jgi:hypothetical protein
MDSVLAAAFPPAPAAPNRATVGPSLLRALALSATITLTTASTAFAQRQEPAVAPPIQASASVSPGVARLGERILYRGRVVSFWGFKWLPPETSEDYTWGPPLARVAQGRASARAAANQPPSAQRPDTLLVEVPLQVFRTGDVVIPGLRFQSTSDRRIYRLPSARLLVTPVLSAADSNADLRPLRGPLPAPWWERVPWLWVIAGVVLVVGAFLLIRRLRKRGKKAAPVVAPALDPAAEALAALSALRGLNLPAHGRFAEHAFHLSRILRRFLEATVRTPRPGDTTGELIAHLETTRMDREDLMRLAGLLRVWDRVKFARAPFSADEASRAELAVETMIKRSAPVPAEKVA